MDYELIITEKAQDLLDDLVRYLLFERCSRQAASHLLDSIQEVYRRMQSAPYSFPLCDDSILKRNGYRKALLPDMSYVIIFLIEDRSIYILGIFHELENYGVKL